MLASRLHTSSSHDVTTSTAQTRLTAAAASSTRRHSVLVTKKDVGLVKDCELCSLFVMLFDVCNGEDEAVGLVKDCELEFVDEVN